MSGAETRTRRGSEEEIVFMPPAAPKSPWVTIFLAFVVVASLLPLGLYVYYGTVQRSLELAVEREGLSVRFGVGRIDIPWEDMAGVAYVEQPARMGRVAGAGLPGLQMGWYRLEGYGRVYRLTTAARPVVYVDTRPDAGSARPGTRYVFSPQDAERFAALLQAMRAGAGAEGAPGAPSGPAAGAAPGALPIPAVFRSAPGPSVMVDPLMILAPLVTAPLVFIILYFARKGARGLRYAVGPQGVGVYHLGRKVYRWDAVRDVRRVDEPLPRVWRLMGAALPGYYAGDFTAGPLGSLKVYATRLKPPLVLMETRLGKVLISPEDVDGFMAAVAEHRPSGS